MSESAEHLRKKIKILPKDYFSTVPDAEKSIFEEYKLFPIDLLVKLSIIRTNDKVDND